MFWTREPIPNTDPDYDAYMWMTCESCDLNTHVDNMCEDCDMCSLCCECEHLGPEDVNYDNF